MFRKAAPHELSRSQFDAARLAFFQVLRRKRMSPQFIERHGEDLFAQAAFEYSRQLAEGKRIRNPVAWLITCAWHRTVNLLEARDWTPRMVSAERVGELGADEAPTPEDAFLTADRHRKLRSAVERLPADQRRLLALTYFEEESVREASRRLEWSASKGQRAHKTAQRRLHKLLGVEASDELAFETGLVAFISLVEGGFHPIRVAGAFEGGIDAIAHQGTRLAERALDLARHALGAGRPAALTPTAAQELGGRAASAGALRGHTGAIRHLAQRISDSGRRLLSTGGADASAAAAAGGGDRLAEVCKAAVAVCLIGGGTALSGALLGSGHEGNQAKARVAPAGRARPSPSPVLSAASQDLAEPFPSPPASASPQRSSAATASSQPSPAARRAAHHRHEEEALNENWGADSQVSAMANAPAESTSSSSSTSSTSSAETTQAPAQTSAEKAEMSQAETQFHGEFK
jgi:RNA polymerase sigma factor (sigma-70 family)